MDLIDAATVARQLHVDARTLERWRTDGTGPRFVRVGRRVFYRRRDIESWLDSRTRSSTSETDRPAA